MSDATSAGQLVVVDASVVTKVLLPEELSNRADAFWESTLRAGRRIVAPSVLTADVATILLQRRRNDDITGPEADSAFGAYLDLGIEFLDPPGLDGSAFALARSNRLRTIQPALYAALATLLDAELWTGDRAVLKALGSTPGVRWIGDVES